MRTIFDSEHVFSKSTFLRVYLYQMSKLKPTHLQWTVWNRKCLLFLQPFQRGNPNTIYHKLCGAGPGVCSFVYNSSCNKTIRSMVAETGCWCEQTSGCLWLCTDSNTIRALCDEQHDGWGCAGWESTDVDLHAAWMSYVLIHTGMYITSSINIYSLVSMVIPFA